MDDPKKRPGPDRSQTSARRFRAFPVSRRPTSSTLKMFARDPAKQRAAWEYVKFATGPVGATLMVKATGYFPANALPAKDPALLGDFYKQSPNHQTAIGQLPMLTAWYAFPGR
jgi:multiple sugar transport system substrate-binding protein